MSLIRSLFGPTLVKGAAPPPPRARNLDFMAITPDGMQSGDYYGTAHPGTGTNGIGPMSFDMIDWYMRSPGVQAPPHVRIGQVIDFCQLAESEHEQGLLVRLRDRKKTMTKGAKAKAAEIGKVIMAGAGPYATADGGMAANMSMFVRQSLDYDQAIFEPLGERKKIAGWYVHDARYFRLVRPTQQAWATGRWYPTGTDPMYAQTDGNGQTRRVFARNEMCWFVRNPRADVRLRGYGWPEVDRMRRLVDALVDVWTYNESGYRNGTHMANIVTIRQQMEEHTWQALTRRFYTMLTSTRNALRTLFFQANSKDEGVDVQPLGATNSDMQFAEWLNWLYKNYIGGWLMDPAEIGVLYGEQGQRGGFGGRESAEERIETSKERGLRPLLRALGAALSGSIVQQMDEDFECLFVGLGLPGEEERLEMTLKKVGAVMTVKEARELLDLEALTVDSAVAQELIDNVPLHPSLVQAFMQDVQQAQAQQQAGGGYGDDGGEDGPESGGEPDDGEDGAPFNATMMPQSPSGAEPEPAPANPDDVMKSLFRDPEVATRALADWLAHSGRVAIHDRGAGVKTWSVQIEVPR